MLFLHEEEVNACAHHIWCIFFPWLKIGRLAGLDLSSCHLFVFSVVEPEHPHDQHSQAHAIDQIKLLSKE